MKWMLFGVVISCIVVGLYLVGILRYLFFMRNVKRVLERKGMRVRKTVISPFSSWLRGRYAVLFRGKNSDLNITFMIAKKKHYHFSDIYRLDFYKIEAHILSGGGEPLLRASVENKWLGKQKLSWGDLNDPHTAHILLFNNLPNKITDAFKRGELGNGDVICGSTIRLMDWEELCRRMDSDIGG